MRHRQKKKRRPISEINVVPYIDVMLVLLVIFMITAPLLTQGVKVALPQTHSKPLSKENSDPLIVTIDEKGQYFINVGGDPKQIITAETLVNRVAAILQLEPKTPVYVRGDKQVEYGKVVIVMALLQKSGAPSVGLMTEPIKQAN